MERVGEVRLLVRGIARGVSSIEIAELFAPYGVDAERIALPRDRRTRRRKGIAYVMVANARQAAEAIKALDKTVLQDKTITIETAAERPPRRPRRFRAAAPLRPAASDHCRYFSTVSALRSCVESGSWPNSARARRWRSRSHRRSSCTLIAPRRVRSASVTSPPFSSSACSSPTSRSICWCKLLVVHAHQLPVSRPNTHAGSSRPARHPGPRGAIQAPTKVREFCRAVLVHYGAGGGCRPSGDRPEEREWLTQRRTTTRERPMNRAGAPSWPTRSSHWEASSAWESRFRVVESLLPVEGATSDQWSSLDARARRRPSRRRPTSR